MAKYRCPVCQEAFDEELLTLHVGRELALIRRIKQQRPEWVEADGVCPRCAEALRAEERARARAPGEQGRKEANQG